MNDVTGKKIRSGLLGLIVLGGLTAVLNGSALASAPSTCHNPSGCPTPVYVPTQTPINPSINADASYTTVDVWGSGFTPGGSVVVYVTDSLTNALVAETVLTAVNGSIAWRSATNNVCEGGRVPRIVKAEDLSSQKSAPTVNAFCH